MMQKEIVKWFSLKDFQIAVCLLVLSVKIFIPGHSIENSYWEGVISIQTISILIQGNVALTSLINQKSLTPI